MAQQVQTLFINDLDGSDAEGTVRFGLDGTEYVHPALGRADVTSRAARPGADG